MISLEPLACTSLKNNNSTAKKTKQTNKQTKTKRKRGMKERSIGPRRLASCKRKVCSSDFCFLFFWKHNEHAVAAWTYARSTSLHDHHHHHDHESQGLFTINWATWDDHWKSPNCDFRSYSVDFTDSHMISTNNMADVPWFRKQKSAYIFLHVSCSHIDLCDLLSCYTW